MSQYEYLGMTVLIGDGDTVNREYFEHCARHDFHLQCCVDCGLLHYPPSTGCPWCGSSRSEWRRVEGRGVVHSYEEVTHAIQPGFASHTPYLVLLVELDTQRGTPTQHEALRILGNLVMPDGRLSPPSEVAKVGIGSRMKMAFTDVQPGFSIPQWTLDLDAAQPVPWRYPG